MIPEIALFWAVVAGFLIADNFLLIPKGGDFLRVGRSGAFKYESCARLEARGRDFIFLNPLNLFDRAAITSSCIGQINAPQFRRARRKVRSALPRLNVFAWVGYVYLVVVVILAATSFLVGFELVLYAFIACHAVFWFLTTSMLLAWRHNLTLSDYQVFVYAAEALFVPAYNINMGKRLWYKHMFDLPALALGLRQLKSIKDEASRELYIYEMGKRLDDLVADLEIEGLGSKASVDECSKNSNTVDGKAEAAHAALKWLKEARTCLTT